jgi:hypothetical protein
MQRDAENNGIVAVFVVVIANARLHMKQLVRYWARSQHMVLLQPFVVELVAVV